MCHILGALELWHKHPFCGEIGEKDKLKGTHTMRHLPAGFRYSISVAYSDLKIPFTRIISQTEPRKDVLDSPEV